MSLSLLAYSARSMAAEGGGDLRREREKSSMVRTVTKGRFERLSNARREAEGGKCKGQIVKLKGVHTIDERAKDIDDFSQPVLR